MTEEQFDELRPSAFAIAYRMLGSVSDVMILDVAEGQIQAVSSIANPDKLRHLGPVADLRAPLRKRGN
jgi:RNA polymerase sigma-70 factor (ECF subfamily)